MISGFLGLYAGLGVWSEVVEAGWRRVLVPAIRPMYAVGKKTFLGSVACDTCPYASLELNSRSQRRVAQPATRPETGGSDWSGIIVVARHP